MAMEKPRNSQNPGTGEPKKSARNGVEPPSAKRIEGPRQPTGRNDRKQILRQPKPARSLHAASSTGAILRRTFEKYVGQMRN